MNILLFILFFACWDGVKASKTNKPKSRLRKIFMTGALLTANEVLNSESDKRFSLCPLTLPKKNVNEMFLAIACSKDNDHIFQKYLVQTLFLDNEDKCGTFSMYQRAKDVAKCTYNYSKKIVDGAQSLLLGKNTEVNHVEMLGDFLNDLVDDRISKQLQKSAENLENFDFFQFVRIYEYTQKMYPEDQKEAAKEAVKEKYQTLDFDKLDRIFLNAQKIYPDDQKMAAKWALEEEYKTCRAERYNTILTKIQNIFGKELGARNYFRWTHDPHLTLNDIERALQPSEIEYNKPPTSNSVWQKIDTFKTNSFEKIRYNDL